MVELDLYKESFSMRGSYMAVSHIGKYGKILDDLHIRSVHGGIDTMEVFKIELCDQDGKRLTYKEVGTAGRICLMCSNGKAELCYEDKNTLRIRCMGCSVILSMYINGYDSAIPMKEGVWQINSSSHFTNYVCSRLEGKMEVSAPWNSHGCTGITISVRPTEEYAEIALEEFLCNAQSREYTKSFQQCAAETEMQFTDWMAKLPAGENKYRKACERAGYVMWSAYAAAQGLYKREAMLMSKNWMNSVWSWDHCFNAMALSLGHPDEAYEQLKIVFDNQHESGVLPDFVNDRIILWNFTKTPIQGWALQWLIDREKVTWRQAFELYEPLCRWTNWWFTYRDYDGDGVPQCNHGNDSVSDNCTPFDYGCPLESPVLSAFLIRQMDILADLAVHMGRGEEAREWKKRADDQMELFCSHFWLDGRIVCRLSGSHEVISEDSVYHYVPVILGKRMTDEMKQWFVKGLSEEGYLLTSYGLASESPKSSRYESDSYCRGPIWASMTMIIVAGLCDIGERELAEKIAERFCDMVAPQQMAECFDAVTGEGLRDPSYTWTASVFLVLANEYIGTGE